MLLILLKSGACIAMSIAFKKIGEALEKKN